MTETVREKKERGEGTVGWSSSHVASFCLLLCPEQLQGETWGNICFEGSDCPVENHELLEKRNLGEGRTGSINTLNT
jgi:hypothetical protein